MNVVGARELKTMFDEVRRGGEVSDERIVEVARWAGEDELNVLIEALIGRNIRVAVVALRIMANILPRQVELIKADASLNAKLLGAVFKAFHCFGKKDVRTWTERLIGIALPLWVHPDNYNYVMFWLRNEVAFARILGSAKTIVFLSNLSMSCERKAA